MKILLFILLAFMWIGCHSRNGVQWIHDKKGVWQATTKVSDSSVDFPYPITTIVKHDTVFIHDTIRIKSKATHINNAQSVIIGGDSNGEIIQSN